MRELAGELLALYARRQNAPGIAYDLSHDWLERLEATFPYRETADQQPRSRRSRRTSRRRGRWTASSAETSASARRRSRSAPRSPSPLNGKQTLMLVPTTVLAQQHWNTFRERYRDFPVTRRDGLALPHAGRRQAGARRLRQAGKVDVLIGTHRVLSRDVIPKELGLVIVDEEQRFGVAQKELLRSLRLEVDVLALTATPIPRTLHMSLSGLRDISIIETPPEGRRPIRTHVGEYDEELVKTALEREVARGGQAFYLHNRVETIDEAADKLRQLVPAPARHSSRTGRCASASSRSGCSSFLRGDADVLVSTTIIESGLDIPQANTLVVERADALGLAQLYQIRGRVGRSDLLAHAYLFYPDASRADAGGPRPPRDPRRPHRARRRLRDRDARPRDPRRRRAARRRAVRPPRRARLRALRRAARTRRSPSSPGERRVAARPVRVDARIDAYVPAEYIPAEAQKIDLHRRLALTEDEDELRELEAATVDRYGPLPEPVENLFAIQDAKLKLARLGADYLVFRGGRSTVGPLVLGSEGAARAPRAGSTPRSTRPPK